MVYDGFHKFGHFEDGSLLLTSSAFVKPLSSLWRIGETQEHMLDFHDEYFVEFSKRSQDRIIGTREEKATVRPHRKPEFKIWVF